MRRISPLPILLLLCMHATALAQDDSRYVWEFPEAADIRLPADRRWMLDDLRLEVDKVLAAGHLAPYYFNAGDLHHEGYFLHVAPGRIITTLAWAYPHLTEAQQAKVREYVAAELANPAHAPWAGPKLPWNEGAGREGLGKPKGFNFDRWWGMEGQHRPFMHTLYGLWLYAHRSGDAPAVRRHWPKIASFYVANQDKAELYGELGAHIAIARLAHQFGDEPTQKLATNNTAKCFAAGRDYAAIERLSLKYFNRLKEKRHNVLGSTHFMLLNMPPEVGRFLADHVKEPILAKHAAIQRAYPHWWLIAPPYSSWAGNIGPDCEGVGLPREIFGMVYPVERWVAAASPDTLTTFMSSGPDGLGDCHWLEPLVWTIESHGQTRWTDVRTRKP